MFEITKRELEWGGRTLTMETGRIARQATGAVYLTYGDTAVLATVVAILGILFSQERSQAQYMLLHKMQEK